MCPDQESSRRPFGAEDNSQPTEPQPPGQVYQALRLVQDEEKPRVCYSLSLSTECFSTLSLSRLATHHIPITFLTVDSHCSSRSYLL